jgi:hypothetical protein
MAKPTWAMQPPKLVDPHQSAADAFVSAGAETLKRSDAQTSKATVQRKDGRELRRMTVYLPADLAGRLRVCCAGRDVDVSEFVAEAVAAKLGEP